jgi:hypothetical protein
MLEVSFLNCCFYVLFLQFSGNLPFRRCGARCCYTARPALSLRIVSPMPVTHAQMTSPSQFKSVFPPNFCSKNQQTVRSIVLSRIRAAEQIHSQHNQPHLHPKRRVISHETRPQTRILSCSAQSTSPIAAQNDREFLPATLPES